jgi:hypothetical protein
VLRLVDKLTDLLVEAEKFDEAVKYAVWSAEALSKAMPHVYPLRGIQLARAGKLQHVLGMLRPAIGSFTAALEVLAVTHGSDHALVADIVQRLGEAKAEMASR